MPKLQQIKRKDGTLVHSINIPIGIIEELRWRKGDELGIEVHDRLSILVTKIGGDENGDN